MPPPLAKAIGLEIKRCMLAKARESASGTVGAAGVQVGARGPFLRLRGRAQMPTQAGNVGNPWEQGAVSLCSRRAAARLTWRAINIDTWLLT